MELEIRVSAKTPSNNLANSIVAAYREHKEITLCAIGPIPISQSVKAVCIANRALAASGDMLGITPGLDTKEIPDKDTGQIIHWVV